MEPVLIIIRGAPSTGKTTIAYLLSKKLPNTILISIDSLVQMNLAQKYSDSECVEARPLGHRMAKMLIRDLLKEGTSVIVEEALPFEREIQKLKEPADDLGYHSFVFELTVPLNVALEREKTRPYAREGKPVEEVMRLIERNPCPEAIKIAASGKTPEEIAVGIMNHIDEVLKLPYVPHRQS